MMHFAVATLLWLLSVQGAIYTDVSALPRTSYDYIIVGGGTAGNVLATRLTENSAISVLVIEAGGSDEGIQGIQAPLMAPTLSPGTPYDWNYASVPQPGLNGRTSAYPAGKVLGGSSSINFFVYLRGSRDDFNSYARLTRDAGWSWPSIARYISKHEKFVPPADGHNTNGQYNPAYHGNNGAVSVSLPGFASPIDSRVIAALQEPAISQEFKFNRDMNGGDTVGLSWVQGTIGQGSRSSSTTAYLRPALSRPKLDVLVNHQVTRVLQTSTQGGKPVVKGVEFTKGAGLTVYTLTSKKETILAAGTIGTPKLLLQSGIGPRAALNALNIPVILDNPSVGKNMSDHVLLTSVYEVNSTKVAEEGMVTNDLVFRNPGPYMDQWTNERKGPFANGITNQLGFFRLPKNDPIWQTESDPSSGSTSGHWEMLFANMFFSSGGAASPSTGTFMSISTNLMTPQSRGTVSLSSVDPFSQPIVDPALLSKPLDVYILKHAIKASRRFASSAAFSSYILHPFSSAFANAQSDAAIEEYIRWNATSTWHPTGTCGMSAKNAGYGVVDPDLKVKGVVGLRIVDASVFPTSPSTYHQGPVYLVAERAADIIAGRG